MIPSALYIQHFQSKVEPYCHHPLLESKSSDSENIHELINRVRRIKEKKMAIREHQILYVDKEN